MTPYRWIVHERIQLARLSTALPATTGKFSLTAIETLALTVTDAGTNTVDLSSSSGVSAVTIAASAGAGNGVITVKGLASGTTVSTTDAANDFDGTLTVALADATGHRMPLQSAWKTIQRQTISPSYHPESRPLLSQETQPTVSTLVRTSTFLGRMPLPLC